MKLKTFLAAAPLILIASLAIAQAVAPVVVASTPATTEAVQNSAWWSGMANEVIAWAVSAVGAVLTAGGIAFIAWLRQHSKLASLVITQTMVDRMIAGIMNIIRASAIDLEHKLGTIPANAAGNAFLTQEQKRQVATAAQPKVEEAFKETLERIGKTPGSQAVNDMILGHVDQALAKPAAAAPVIPAVMQRS